MRWFLATAEPVKPFNHYIVLLQAVVVVVQNMRRSTYPALIFALLSDARSKDMKLKGM